MKLLFSARPAYGHVYPLVPLARRRAPPATRSCSRRPAPSSAAWPGSASRPTTSGSTIEAARDELVGSLGVGDAAARPPAAPTCGWAGACSSSSSRRRTATDLLPVLAAIRPDVVVYEQLRLRRRLAAAVVGIPAAGHAVSPRLPDEVPNSSGDLIDRLWADHGSRRPPSTCSPVTCTSTASPPCCARRTRRRPARLPLRPVPFADPAPPRPDWIGQRSAPLVYLTLGTIVATDDRAATRDRGPRPPRRRRARRARDPPPAASSVRCPRTCTSCRSSTRPRCCARRPRRPPRRQWHAPRRARIGTPQVLLPTGADQFWQRRRPRGAGLVAVLEPDAATAEAVDAVAERMPWPTLARPWPPARQGARRAAPARRRSWTS